jgi:AraC-like DNA-binding protein
MDTPESDLQLESMLFTLLAFLIRYFSALPPPLDKTQAPKDSIKQVCDYIARNFKTYISLKQLADMACLSPFHFQREFKKHIGITPHEYLSDCRIREAKKMLLKSGDIADIAIRLGFFDQSHFSRVFKKSVGVPPGKFRRTNMVR